ncbi:MAG: response regulator [Deltaproteobacteria bacterium]|nr:response regulator [Myxococcales bacterium]MDP3215525.1 response regulator [Deltaproteobacteria bacterium]
MSAEILIVDDSLTVRMDLAETFEAAGFRAVPCATLAEARGALARGSAAMMILDVHLPDGDGIDLLRAVRETPSSVGLPVLLLSTEPEVRDRLRGLGMGPGDCIGKPYDAAAVVARVREILGRGAGAAGAAARTVLVIDDSATYREALRGALTEAGYAVVLAASGEEGLRLVAAERPAAVVVDGVMPGIDGPTVIRRLRLDAALVGTPCLLLTAAEDAGAELRALDAGADAFVRKGDDLEVILARLAALLRSAEVGGARPAALASPKRVLLVDDSATYLHELTEVLRGEGYVVVQARSGEEAIERITAEDFDCVLLDVVMPGIGGHETCRRMKASTVTRDVPLIMMTAGDDRDAMVDGLSTGADDFLAKSAEFEVLKARVRAQLRRKQFEDEHRRVRERLLRSAHEATEARAARELAEARAALSEELERRNRELEAFSYSVSHDLRAPLRAIDGFSAALQEDHAAQLDDDGRANLAHIRAAAKRMSELIDDLLSLSKVSRADLARGCVDLGPIAASVADDLGRGRAVSFVVGDGLLVDADPRLMRVVFENLLGNAWKFTSKTPAPRVEVGATVEGGAPVYFVRDNGAGFDEAYAGRLFSPFQRLHTEREFPGTGIGLATVQRIIDRHGGRVWARGEPGRGATFYFTLGRPRALTLVPSGEP